MEGIWKNWRTNSLDEVSAGRGVICGFFLPNLVSFDNYLCIMDMSKCDYCYYTIPQQRSHVSV